MICCFSIMKTNQINQNSLYILLQLINAPEYLGVATCNLKRNHIRDPFLFVHKILPGITKDLIIAMTNNGVDNTGIAKIISEIDGTFLSSAIITNISKKEKRVKKKTCIA